MLDKTTFRNEPHCLPSKAVPINEHLKASDLALLKIFNFKQSAKQKLNDGNILYTRIIIFHMAKTLSKQQNITESHILHNCLLPY